MSDTHTSPSDKFLQSETAKLAQAKNDSLELVQQVCTSHSADRKQWIAALRLILLDNVRAATECLPQCVEFHLAPCDGGVYIITGNDKRKIRAAEIVRLGIADQVLAHLGEGLLRCSFSYREKTKIELWENNVLADWKAAYDALSAARDGSPVK